MRRCLRLAEGGLAALQASQLFVCGENNDQQCRGQCARGGRGDYAEVPAEVSASPFWRRWRRRTGAVACTLGGAAAATLQKLAGDSAVWQQFYKAGRHSCCCRSHVVDPAAGDCDHHSAVGDQEQAAVRRGIWRRLGCPCGHCRGQAVLPMVSKHRSLGAGRPGHVAALLNVFVLLHILWRPAGR